MEELYKMIEDKIRQAGYPSPVDGAEIYNEICDEIDQKEEGSYIFMAKKEEGVFYEYKIDILKDQFNLSYLDIHTPLKVFHIDFDA